VALAAVLADLGGDVEDEWGGEGDRDNDHQQ
jgi:hypothetical protein